MRSHKCIRVIVAMGISLSIASSTFAQSPATMPAKVDLSVPDKQVDAGLEFLARQQATEGFINSNGPKIALTGLSLMAFLAAGHTPDVGPYGVVVRRALDWLVQQVPADGYVGNTDSSRMYGQGIVTLALAEAYGVETDGPKRQRLNVAITRALQVILKAQQVAKDPAHAGGWRYEMNSPDSDLSLSGWNALALRACRNIGLDVPGDSVGGAVQYVIRCFRADQNGFSYQPGLDVAPSMTGVGVLSLQLLSPHAESTATTRPEAQAGGVLLGKMLVDETTRFGYYSHYYVTQAAFQLGGDVWAKVWPNARTRLLALQTADGGWPPSTTAEEPERVYATAMSLLTLTVPYQILPIYQR
jgi:hypothetical protein